MASKASRMRAIALYKELHRLGRDYDPSYNFHGKLRRMFESKCTMEHGYRKQLHTNSTFCLPENKNLTNEEEIEKAFEFGEYIKKETLALYSLRKYRHLKRMYPSNSMSDP
ncbi:hypothetical protein BJ138DRAFT_1014807 [Hygrophoropsis aurantiaca]|uniref:Uncharacterized protein n=1 Tax=Hygrophoropsis aurantiaca TaxID=72124 RepID=A0ACB8A2R2_9AGAM|nr:hypothetical protein BJ138DRAFT_1014807 [Hygrophoropsis aurantiaca]